ILTQEAIGLYEFAAELLFDRIHQRARPWLLLRTFRLRGSGRGCRLRTRRGRRRFGDGGLAFSSGCRRLRLFSRFFRLLAVFLFVCHLNSRKDYPFREDALTQRRGFNHIDRTSVNAHRVTEDSSTRGGKFGVRQGFAQEILGGHRPPYSLGSATVGALYERPRSIFCAKPSDGEFPESARWPTAGQTQTNL